MHEGVLIVVPFVAIVGSIITLVIYEREDARLKNYIGTIDPKEMIKEIQDRNSELEELRKSLKEVPLEIKENHIIYKFQRVEYIGNILMESQEKRGYKYLKRYLDKTKNPLDDMISDGETKEYRKLLKEYDKLMKNRQYMNDKTNKGKNRSRIEKIDTRERKQLAN